MSASILLISNNDSFAHTFTRRLSSKDLTVYSVIRNTSQVADLKALGARPVVQSVENSSVSDFVKIIKDIQPGTIIWSAGAGAGVANNARLKLIDTKVHIRVIDAVAKAAQEAGTTRRFITISSLEVRDNFNRPMPDWYDAEDIWFSKSLQSMFNPYFRARLVSDKSPGGR